jgi:two-component system response regulator (stage 0 sporulation protein A)
MRASLRDELKEQGFANIYEAQNGEEALAMIIGAEPEIVIIDVLLSKLDGIGVIRQARERLGEDAPTFIATSMVGNHNMLLEASSAGASMCMMKPINASSLARHIENLLPASLAFASNNFEEYGANDIEAQVTKIIHQIGVPAHIKGYQYLRTAIILTVNDSDIINSVLKYCIPPWQRNIRPPQAVLNAPSATRLRSRGIGGTSTCSTHILAIPFKITVVNRPIPSSSQ